MEKEGEEEEEGGLVGGRGEGVSYKAWDYSGLIVV